MCNKNIKSPRTDMAVESHRLWNISNDQAEELKGVKCKDYKLCGIEVNEIEIIDSEGEASLSKARGKYFSISLPDYFERGSADFSQLVLCISKILNSFNLRMNNVLVAALGNPDISPDALGNLAAANILVTRHLKSEEFKHFSSLSLCRPGVLGSSGIESAVQLKALCNIVQPDCMIVIDALAGSDAKRLCRCIQISNAGIDPGSGVGNDRAELSLRSIGIPVLAIGIPTVIDAAYFAGEDFQGMFVTPHNIDALVRAGGRLIAYGINLAVHKGLSIQDVDSLIL